MFQIENLNGRFMTEETNNQNLDNLDGLLPYFLEGDQFIDLIPQSHGQVPTAIRLLLDNQHRYWFELGLEPDQNQAWQAFKNMAVNHPKVRDLNITYDLFTAGRTRDGQRLFKVLKKLGPSDDEIAGITTTYNQDTQYLCLSRNPIDFLFMSTNQSFSSCLDLESDYKGAYYMYLPGLMADPFAMLAFITTGKLRTYSVKSCTFKHFRVINRARIVVSPSQGFICAKSYPRDDATISNLVSRVLPPHRRVHSRSWFQTPEFPAIFYQNDPIYPYIDNPDCVAGLPQTRTLKHSDLYGISGSLISVFNYTKGFEASDIDDIDSMSRPYACCEECDCDLDEEEIFRNNGDEIFCESCYYDRYFNCTACGCEDQRGDAYEPQGRNDLYCESCYHERFTVCQHCEDEVEIEDCCSVGDETWCESCYNQYSSTCDECGDCYAKDDLTDAIDSDGDIVEVCNSCLSSQGYTTNEDDVFVHPDAQTPVEEEASHV